MEHELVTGEWVALGVVALELVTLLVLMAKGYTKPLEYFYRLPPRDADEDPPPKNPKAA